MDVNVDKLSYMIKLDNGEYKQLLHSVSATFPKGVVNVLMGHSGAGKTTLMDLIAHCKYTGVVEGRISYNKMPTIRRSEIAYIQTFDVHIAEFTVRQNLYFHAKLRLGNMTEDEYFSHCHDAAAAVNLESALDTLTGSEGMKGLSGGQKKRLSIAVELLAVPSVLCLDEPTSGLDSSTSLQVAECLANLAQGMNKTIICTIHSPSQDMLNVWHNLFLMSSGKFIYCGAMDEVRDYFQALGYRSNESTDNAVEFALELLAEDVTASTLAELWLASNTKRPTLCTVDDVDNSRLQSSSNSGKISSLKEKTRDKLGLFQQIRILTHRHALYTLKCVHGITAMLLRNIAAGVAFGVLYYNSGAEMLNDGVLVDLSTKLFTANCINMQALQFLVVIYVIVINIIAVPTMCRLNRLYKREQAASLYSPLAFWMSLFLVDVTSLLLGTAIFAILLQYMVEIHGHNYIYYLVTFLASTAGYVQAKLCGWSSDDGISGFILFALVACLEVILSGFIIVKESVPDYLSWMMYMTFSGWGTGALMFNEFNNLLNVNNTLDESYSAYSSQGEIVLVYYGIEDFMATASIFILVAFVVAMECLVIYYLQPPKSQIVYVSDDDSIQKILSIKSSGDNNERRTSFSMSISSSLLDDDTLRSTTTKNVGRRQPRQSLSTLSSFRPSLMMPYSSIHHSGKVPNIRGSRCTEPSDIFRISALNMIDERNQAKFVFKNVSYTVNNKGTKRELLQSVSGMALPGELCAVMGSSGAGKTTLLNVLAGQANMGVMTGSISVNGTSLKVFKEGTGSSHPPWAYIMQTDVHLPTLTVRETLEYAAMLRMKETTAKSSVVTTAVTGTMDLLGLSHVADNLIGSGDDMHISCGQLRRLSIAVEIIHKPNLIFADEPTSGLDSYLVSTVVDGLVNLAKSSATVVCTIHQPSPVVFFKFHKILLLSKGCVLYFGSTVKCRSYFEGLGFTSLQPNAAEFIISIAADLSESEEGSEYTGRKSLGECVRIMNDEIMELMRHFEHQKLPVVDSTTPNEATCRHIFPFSTMLVLLKRSLTNIGRRSFWISSLIRSFFIGVFTGLMWIESEEFQDYIGFYFMSYFLTNLWLLEVIPGLHEDKMIFFRERNGGATTTFASCMTMSVPILALSFLVCATYLVPALALMGSFRSLRSFAQYFGILYLGTVVNIFINQLAAAITPSPMIHTLIFPGMVVPIQSIFSGFAVITSTMFPWIQWGVHLNSMKWVMNGLFQIDLKENDSALGIYNFDDLEELYGWGASISDCFKFVTSSAVAFLFLSFISMKYVQFNKA